MPLFGIALARQILSLLLFLSPTRHPLAPSPLLRPYPYPLPLLRNSFLFLDALSFLLLRALLAFALICNEVLCVYSEETRNLPLSFCVSLFSLDRPPLLLV